MLFNSFEFLIFFPVVLLFNYLIPCKYRYIWLLVASYFFYMFWNTKYAVLLFLSTIVTYNCALGIESLKYSRSRYYLFYQKTLIFVGVFLNLAILFFFKYSNFALDIISKLALYFNANIHTPTFDIILPVGISFYTFQAIGYMIDVYRDEIEAERNFLKYALFISFFPQLVAGPIERSGNILGQINNPRKFNYTMALDGLMLIIWGFFLKIVLADRIAIFVDSVYSDVTAVGGIHLIIATVLFAIQIYCDFYGYSSIAIGASRILGIRLMENFNAPYLSSSVASFWRNWHISLTSWFRDYLYIPMGGSRKGELRKLLNKMFVFLCSGLWHGASINFVIWGGINGAYQVIGDIFRAGKYRLLGKNGLKEPSAFSKIFGCIFTFVLIDFSWIFFRANSYSDAVLIINTIINETRINSLLDGSLLSFGLDARNLILIAASVLILTIGDICKRKGIIIHEVIVDCHILRWFFIAVAIYFVMLFGIWGPEYNPSNFIYFQF